MTLTSAGLFEFHLDNLLKSTSSVMMLNTIQVAGNVLLFCLSDEKKNDFDTFAKQFQLGFSENF